MKWCIISFAVTTISRNHCFGVPAIVQWIKNPPAVTWVGTEAWVRSLALHSGLKDLTLPQLQRSCSCGSDSVTGTGNFYMLWVQPLKKMTVLLLFSTFYVELPYIPCCMILLRLNINFFENMGSFY